MQSSNYFTKEILEQFMIDRDLNGDEQTYQKLKEDSKLAKRTLKSNENLVAHFEKKNAMQEAEAIRTTIHSLQEQQNAINLQLIENRNPDASTRHTWIDLHGFGLQQGANTIINHIFALQKSLISGVIKPNNDTIHVFQVITGPGKLADRINDTFALAGFEFFGSRGNGKFLVKLTLEPQDMEMNFNKIEQHAAMIEEHKNQWIQIKNDIKSQKHTFREQEKSKKSCEKEEQKNVKYDQKQANKEERKAAKAEEKAQKMTEKDNFQTQKRAIKEGMKNLGYVNGQISQAGKAVNYSSLEDALRYACDNEITPKKLTKTQQ